MNIAKLLKAAIRIAKPIVKAAPKVVEVVKAVRGEKRKRE